MLPNDMFYPTDKTAAFTLGQSKYKVSDEESRCTFKKINDEFSKGKFRDVEIIFMNNNRYINCSKIYDDICKKSDSINQTAISSWLTDEKNENLIEDVEQQTDLLRHDLLIDIVIPKFRGMYMHPLLADHIIYWFGGKNMMYYMRMIREFMLLKKDDEIMELFITKYPGKTTLGDEDLAIENNNLRAELLLFSTHKAGFTLNDLVSENSRLKLEISRLRQELSNSYSTTVKLQQAKTSAIKTAPTVQYIKKISRRSISPPRTAIPRRNDGFVSVLPRSKSLNITCRRNTEFS